MRQHIDSTVTTGSRSIIQMPASAPESSFVGSSSCLSLDHARQSSDSVIISSPSPCGTPPRKRWEGAYKVFLRKKNPQHSPTLSTSPASTETSIPITEDLSTGTGTSGSSSAGMGGGAKGAKSKSSFSLIPGSKRLVSRHVYNKSKSSALTSIFSKSGSFSRTHKSTDELDVPLRNGIEKSRSGSGSNPNVTALNRHTSNVLNRSSPRSSPLTIQRQQKPTPKSSTADGSVSENDSRGGWEGSSGQAISTSIISTTPEPATSALDAQLRACELSSTSPHGQPYTSNQQIFPGEWHGNQTSDIEVDLASASSSATSLSQLHHRRALSRTYIYSSNSNSSALIHQSQQSDSDQNELGLRMMPKMPSLRGIRMQHRGSSQSSHSSYDDVGLNLDEMDNCPGDDSNQHRYQAKFDPHSSDPHRKIDNLGGSGTATIITDSGILEPPESLDEILGSVGGIVTVHSSSSSHLLSKMEHPIVASPDTRKAFTKIHNSSEYDQDICPFLGGNKASNRDLEGAYKSCIATQQCMMIRSMNSNLRINGGQQVMEVGQNSSPSFISRSLSIDTGLYQNGMRLLKPIQSADSWVQGRRYLIAPAALAACPLSTIKSLTGLTTQSATEAAMSVDPPVAAGVIDLGDAFMTYVGEKYHLTSGTWSPCKLVLRENYLFEYDSSAPLNGIPRGIAHLEHAVAETHQDFEDALQLHFYASPCAKVDHRVLLIRVNKKEERDHWITCLNRAARLRIEDIWDYKKDGPLGNGRYASIYPARRRTNKKINDENENRCDEDIRESNCALKIIDKNEFWRLVAKGRERCDTIVRELAVQSTLTAKFGSKPTFLQIHGFFETSENVVIELELLDGRDLFEYISSKGVLEEEEAGSIISDVLVALNCMSLAGIAHRDIKPANILMTSRDGSKSRSSVKIADFGMSTLVGVDELVRGRCGSPGYVAPEILKADAGEGYRNQVDIFSAGVTLYLMLCGYEPFYGETEKELIRANESALVDFSEEEWRKVSVEAKDLVAKMLKTDPKERITAEEAVEHPWIVRIQQNEKHNCMLIPENTNTVSSDGTIEKHVCAIM
eukprot:CAMPEP_0197195368 /NCGR_PEP_ID=MMETSP1423-20130617/30962_1 /TAXON_ID=476441 /ORGANISM="Pseudo-nitzschia heimii, Strain UNC1101" /LENGTH=1068 /DNA_ID=CAMNT_0042648989 /DNA_START=96 /DNA_END=3302 /DNA_ORIENTATION=+